MVQHFDTLLGLHKGLLEPSGGLSRRIYDKRRFVRVQDVDSVLHGKVISWQAFLLEGKQLSFSSQEGSDVEIVDSESVAPVCQVRLSVILTDSTQVDDGSGRKERLDGNQGHLLL